MKENEKAVYITKELIERSGVSVVTIRNYLEKYTASDGMPLGLKIGGRWKVFPSRFEKFMSEGGVKK